MQPCRDQVTDTQARFATHSISKRGQHCSMPENRANWAMALEDSMWCLVSCFLPYMMEQARM